MTDSAAAGTALYTGHKTLNGRISTDVNGKPLLTIGELAHQNGKSVGVVTTVPACDATPSAVGAHNISRKNSVEIFQEMIKGDIFQVIIGCGHPLSRKVTEKFGEKIQNDSNADYSNVGGEECWSLLRNDNLNGFTLLENLEDFMNVANAKNDPPQKIAGFPVMYSPILPVDGFPEVETEESKHIMNKIFGSQNVTKEPTLSVLSEAALNVLAQNENVFFLMIEGGAIDWASHDQNVENMILEQTAFTKAVDTVCNWVEQNSDWNETVVIVTADHETGQLWGANTFEDKNGDSQYNKRNDEFLGFHPIQNHGVGRMPGMQFASTNHTNALVPIWGKGGNIERLGNYYRGQDKKAAVFWNFSGHYIDNTDVARYLHDCMN